LKRRTFFSRLFGGLGLIPAGAVVGGGTRTVLIQESPIAGFQFHRGASLWPLLRVGQVLDLVREPGNPHDTNAVAVYFNEDRLGYLPRTENQIVAQMLDRDEKLEASIIRLMEDENPWNRVRIRVSLT
jgi:hypothetical protein